MTYIKSNTTEQEFLFEFDKDELQQQQDELDKQEFECPKCKNREPWGLYRDVGCVKDFETYLKKTKKQL